VSPDGSIANVRVKRSEKDEKKVDTWEWRVNPFIGSRELNGLKVMMALINNWDLKDENNAIYKEKEEGDLIYLVSDLGASFGTVGLNRPVVAKGNLRSYSHTKFIRHIGADYVDFTVPGRPAFVMLVTPHWYFAHRKLEWIGKHIPRSDAKWTGQLLGRLSPTQIRDAFRSGGYTPDQVEAFARIVEARIGELNRL
jgi:hypothetical protein